MWAADVQLAGASPGPGPFGATGGPGATPEGSRGSGTEPGPGPFGATPEGSRVQVQVSEARLATPGPGFCLLGCNTKAIAHKKGEAKPFSFLYRATLKLFHVF